jgi:hypothetical protein
MYEVKCPNCDNDAVIPELHGPYLPGTRYEANCPKCGQYFFGNLIEKVPTPPKLHAPTGQPNG